MSTIYTVLEFHADGSRGVDSAEEFGSYRNVDDAYIKLRELVNRQWPNELRSGSRRVYQTSSNRTADTDRQRVDLERQLIRIEDDEHSITSEHNRIAYLISERYPSDTSDLKAEIADVENEYRTLEKHKDRISEKLSSLGASEIVIERIDNRWRVSGGYNLKYDDVSHFHGIFTGHRENAIEATVSLDEGGEGTRFYIIKTQLM